MSGPQKHELLFQRGLNFNDVPAWQRRGAGVAWEDVAQAAVDPRTGRATTSVRRRRVRLLELPVREAYDAFLLGLLEGGET